MDLVKLRMQIQRAEGKKGKSLSQGRFGYRNIFHGLYLMTSQEGFTSYFRSSGVRVTYMGIQSILNLTLLEMIRQKIMEKIETKK